MTTPSPEPQKSYQVDKLCVEVYPTRALMGRAAAHDVAERMQAILCEKQTLTMIFAAAPSQNELLDELCQIEGLPWDRVTAFHMDEYAGLPSRAPQAFGQFLRERIFDRVKPGAVHYVNGEAPDLEAECQRYEALLAQNPPDIVCLGIGENGHLAFNDPGIADFHDPHLIKIVELEDTSRVQQVHDGCFPNLDAVPKRALTLTIPALTRAPWMYCVVPGPTKTAAVRATLTGPITDQCPATILRQHPGATLYLDRVAAGL